MKVYTVRGDAVRAGDLLAFVEQDQVSGKKRTAWARVRAVRATEDQRSVVIETSLWSKWVAPGEGIAVKRGEP